MATKREEVMAKVQKLLSLANSDNHHESAAALARAQGLMTKYQIDSAMLSELDAEEEEEIRDWDAPIEDATRSAWRSTLIQALAKANACKHYIKRSGHGSRASYFLIGRASDVDAVRYLFTYCTREIDRLVKANAYGNGRRWTAEYRIGCAQAVKEAIESEKRAVVETARRDAGTGSALIKMDSAIAKMEQRGTDTIAWARRNKPMRHVGALSYHQSTSGMDAGHRDGRNVYPGGSRTPIGTGTRRLKG